ncbi:RidA family protein [Belnapia rosea]|uniref:RidA family protein n=1 Tax=Belnapia rosea TaxID=938405 RepID=UPI000881822A|nr:RidA family protein [Belnapia rosea]SDB37435.1 Enamine deaminase RidA, house cleaning of reactive enamine intermediates, YjgF/YER057c/UK114 family [Belnapia rosea]
MPLPRRHILAGLPPGVSPSSHAVEADGWIHLTGQLGRDLDNPAAPLPEGCAAQAERALGNLARVLAALGLGMENLVSCRVYLTRFEADYAALNEVWARSFAEGARPSRVCIGVTALALGAVVEIEAVARRP